MTGCGHVSSVSEHGPTAGCCEHGNENPGCVIGKTLLDRLSRYSIWLRRLNMLHAVTTGMQDINVPSPRSFILLFWTLLQTKCVSFVILNTVTFTKKNASDLFVFW